MSYESANQPCQNPEASVVNPLPSLQALEALLLTTLEQHDGICLDNEAERVELAGALTMALTTAGDGMIIPLLLAAIERRSKA